MMNRHCVVLAGGLGTRIQTVTENKIPKALIEVNGHPFLYWKLESLITMGISSVTILVGFMETQIEQYVESADFKLDIAIHSDGPSLLGTAGAVVNALDHLPDFFWLTYADSLVLADLEEAEKSAKRRGLSHVMHVLRNNNQLQMSNTTVVDDLVVNYEKAPTKKSNKWIDYGLLRFSKNDFTELEPRKNIDLSIVITKLVAEKKLFACEVDERFWDVGDPEGLKSTREHFLLRGDGHK